MNILNPQNSWSADHLPAGLALHDGIISGSPTVKGSFSVPVTVSNPLGSDTKNISIISKYRPGFEKFSILQNGVEVDQLTIRELQAMVQDGSAQQRFNCSNTQILLWIASPSLKSWDSSTNSCVIHPSFICEVPANFCDFREVTLQDGSTRNGLILQFDNTLWDKYAPFDTGDSVGATPFNRWRYSNLRQWLNASGSNWFVPAYSGDALITQQQIVDANQVYSDNEKIRYACRSTYADTGSLGFLDLLPEDVASILVPTKLISTAWFDYNNTNESIEDPDDIDGLDSDITFDKVFIPSLRDMMLTLVNVSNWDSASALEYLDEEDKATPWAFWKSYLSAYLGSNASYQPYDVEDNQKGLWPFYISFDNEANDFDSSTFQGSDLLQLWGLSLPLSSDIPPSQAPVLTRSVIRSQDPTGIMSLYLSQYYESNELKDIHCASNNFYANPAPAFVIC